MFPNMRPQPTHPPVPYGVLARTLRKLVWDLRGHDGDAHETAD